jgi:asparagine synthase (glutamine-hydrolysing)
MQDLDRRFDAVFATMNRGGRLVSETRVRPRNGWALGRVHLGILQPKPQFQADGALQVLLHGELDNEDELQSALARAGEQPVDGAAAILAGLYRTHKQGFGRLLKGAFCAAILDEAAGALVLVTDRLGSYPLYWFQTDDRFVFASELRAALRDHPRPALNPAAVADFLEFAFPMGDKTLAAGVDLVPTA